MITTLLVGVVSRKTPLKFIELVMGCERYWFITVEQAWVLARDPNFLQTDQYRELMVCEVRGKKN